MKKSLFFALTALFIFISACEDQKQTNKEINTIQSKEVKSEEASFYDNQLPDQAFEFSAAESNVLEGKEGTLIAVPEGAFLDENGEVYEGPATVILKEAMNPASMVLANLTTQTASGEPLSTAGMFYFEAKGKEGKPLTINPENPVYVEIPTEEVDPAMMVYDGERNEEGNIVWKEPKPLQNWLIPVDIFTLDFLPEGFDKAVQVGMPFRGHKEATEELVDSLYYSLEPYIKERSFPEKVEEVFEEMTYIPDQENIFHLAQEDVADSTHANYIKNGVHPLAIKALKNERFNNTFVATKEFEERLQVIFKTCETEILEVYLKNLDMNLYEADSMVAAYIGKGNYLYNEFSEFAAEKKTKVAGVDKKAAKTLSKYYDQQLQKNLKELKKKKEAYQKALKKADEEAVQLRKEYEKVLTKRAIYRAEKYGFEITKGGWKNVDKVIIEITKDLPKFELYFKVTNGADFDRVHSYTWNPRIKSLWALTSSDKINFNGAFQKDPVLLMYENEPSLAIGVAFKDDKVYFSLQEFKQEDIVNINLTLHEISKEELKKKLNKLEKGAKSFNKIQKDLEYQEQFYKEYLRKKKLAKEREFIQSLEEVAFPCRTYGTASIDIGF